MDPFILPMPDGREVMAIGPGVGIPIAFLRDAICMPFEQIAYGETVRWLAGNERFTFSTMKQEARKP